MLLMFMALTTRETFFVSLGLLLDIINQFFVINKIDILILNPWKES